LTIVVAGAARDAFGSSRSWQSSRCSTVPIR